MDQADEEEILVYAEFENSVNIEEYRNIHILGIDDKNPIIQLDDTIFVGKHENSIGTYLFFDEDTQAKGKHPIFDIIPEKNLKYLFKTRKLIKVQQAYVTPKEGKEMQSQSEHKNHGDDVKPVTFHSIDEGVAAILNIFSRDIPSSDQEIWTEKEMTKKSKNEKRIPSKCLKKSNIEEVLKEINAKSVKIKKDERKNNNKILYSVLKEFINKMCSCNKLFLNLKPRLEYLGSYFDGLRVGRATEYDINIILTLPINYKKVKLISTNRKGAYTSIKMPSEFRRLLKLQHGEMKGYKDTELWCNKDHYLSVTRFRSWMQRIVDATLQTLPLQDGMRILKINNVTYKITAKTSGPANTLIIKENDGNVIDVDLVPTLAFNLPKIPTDTVIDFEKVKNTNIKQYFVVPKPNDSDINWRLAFPFQERHYIYNKQNMKGAIKILKLLRDVQGFHKLASYYIKTIFLWEATESNDDFWKNNSLSYLVIHMLKKLKDCLSQRNIQNFWCPDHNLLEKMKIETCENWSNRLKRIVNNMEKKRVDPTNIQKYFT